MPSSISPIKPSDIIKKVGLMSFSTLAPLITNLFAIIFIRDAYGDNGVFALGSAGNIIGIIVAASAGCSIVSIRSFVQLKLKGQLDPLSAADEFRTQNSQAWRISVLAGLCVFVVCGAFFIFAEHHGHEQLFYLAGVFPWMLLIPFSQVAAGVLQAFALERKIFTASIATVLLQIASIPLIIGLELPLAWTLLSLGLVQSAIAICVYLYRLRLVRQTLDTSVLGSLLPKRVKDRWQGFADRALAGADGLVFMGFFAFLTFVARTHSIEAGAIIALVVSIMRLFVIPMKQFGNIGGRMLLTAGVNKYSLRSLRKASLTFTTPLTLVVLVLAIFLVPYPSVMLIAPMLMVQMFTEPWSGIDFSLAKVLYSPRAMAKVLFTVYGSIGAPIALMLAITGWGGAVEVWSVAFVCRLLFLGGVQKSLKRLHEDDEPSWVSFRSTD